MGIIKNLIEENREFIPSQFQQQSHSTKRLTTEEFIKKAKEVHGNKYDYSETNYVNGRTKVKIICPIHGEFWQVPHNHISRKCGCPKCTKHFVGLDGFIEKAEKVHGKDKYDYSKVDFQGNRTKIEIICPIHGSFWTLPYNFLHGQNCPICSLNNRKIGADEFIRRAKEVHGNEYDYSLVNYVSMKSPVEIICPIHGVFKQRPYDHLQGCGCFQCKESHLEADIANLLLYNNIKFEFQKTWDWLIYKGNQYLDFYLPEYNIGIECQGIQHFEPIGFFGGEEGYKYAMDRDRNKHDLLIDHNIKLLYYSNIEGPYPYTVCHTTYEILKEIYNNQND